jgi:TrmH family RNA methyltransferase
MRAYAGVQARRISSPNDEFQLALSLLTNRRQRQRQGRFVVEGVRAIDQAVEHGWELDSLWYAAGRRLSSWARGLLEHAPSYELAPELMEQLSAKEETSEVVALVRMPPDDLARIRLDRGLALAFDRPASPGNLGSVIRSADALGADGVVVTGHAADLYDPQAVRASVGSLFATPSVRVEAPGEAAAWAKENRLRIVGTSARAERTADELDLAGPLLLVVGNETRGLSEAWRSLADDLVAIPMTGSATSLNAAAAAAVLLYETARQRRA